MIGAIWPSPSFVFPSEGRPQQIASDSKTDAARTEEMIPLMRLPEGAWLPDHRRLDADQQWS